MYACSCFVAEKQMILNAFLDFWIFGIFGFLDFCSCFVSEKQMILNAFLDFWIFGFLFLFCGGETNDLKGIVHNFFIFGQDSYFG